MIKREENERSKKIKRIVLNIIVIIVLFVYGFIVIAPLFDMPMVRILKNFTGDLIHYLLRLTVLIFLIIYIIKCKEEVFKIIFSIILLSLTSIFIIRLIADSVIHDEATLQKIDISKTESLESVYYPDESGFVEVVYKKKIIGTLYCQKTIYSISYGDKELDDINISLEKYYDEIKDKKLGLCGSKIEHKRANYENDDSDVKNSETIILDDAVEIDGKKLDDKVRLVVYPTQNNNCIDDVKLYSRYENSNVYFVCIGEVEIVYHPNISHVETIKYNPKSNIDYITHQMNIKEQFRDGGSIMYQKDNLRILKCNTVDGNKDIYIGYNNLEYKSNYCKGI